MAVTILDPTNEAVPVERQITPRPEVVKGKVAFLDISSRAAVCCWTVCKKHSSSVCLRWKLRAMPNRHFLSLHPMRCARKSMLQTIL